MADGFLVGLGRTNIQCVHCKSSIRDSIRCFCHREIKNVMQTYIRSFHILEAVAGEGEWTVKQFCHKEIYCPKSVLCKQVI